MRVAPLFRWTSAARTHVGRVRSINEDACLALPDAGLFAVADGMGGHAHGEVASRMVVEALERIPQELPLTEAAKLIRETMGDTNARLRGEAARRQARIIGSTVAVLLARGRQCACLWAGDSRIYRCRQRILTALTRDHSQIEELRFWMPDDPDTTRVPPPRNLLTRAVGATDTLELDECRTEVADGDVYLLCSDGLSNDVTDEELRAALLPGDCEAAAANLLDLALQRGGRDNITVVVARADDPCSSDRTAMNPAV